MFAARRAYQMTCNGRNTTRSSRKLRWFTGNFELNLRCANPTKISNTFHLISKGWSSKRRFLRREDRWALQDRFPKLGISLASSVDRRRQQIAVIDSKDQNLVGNLPVAVCQAIRFEYRKAERLTATILWLLLAIAFHADTSESISNICEVSEEIREDRKRFEDREMWTIRNG